MKIIPNLIAYQTVGKNSYQIKAITFENEKDVSNFFSNPLLVMKALDFELYEDEHIENYTIHGNYDAITFYCKYAHNVVIERISRGAIIKSEEDEK